MGNRKEHGYREEDEQQEKSTKTPAPVKEDGTNTPPTVPPDQPHG
jgi:hypothetical protein